MKKWCVTYLNVSGIIRTENFFNFRFDKEVGGDKTRLDSSRDRP